MFFFTSYLFQYITKKKKVDLQDTLLQWQQHSSSVQKCVFAAHLVIVIK